MPESGTLHDAFVNELPLRIGFKIVCFRFKYKGNHLNAGLGQRHSSASLSHIEGKSAK